MLSLTGKIAFGALAVIGVVIWLVAIGLHLAGIFTGHTYEIDRTVLIIGGLFGFVGFYGLDPRHAKDGGAFIVEQGVKVLGAIKPRFGRRASDAIAVPNVTTTTTAVPTAQIDPTVPVAAPTELVVVLAHRESEKGE